MQAQTRSMDLNGAAIAGAGKNVAELAGKRVLVLINADGGGGVEHLAAVLGGNLERQRAQVRVDFVYPGTSASPRAKLGGILRAAQAVCRWKPDIVMAFQPTSAAIAAVVGRLTGCPVRIIHQSNMPGSTHVVPRLIDRAIGALGFYSCNITNSSATEAAFVAYPAGYKRRLERIEHGIAWRAPKRDRAQTLAAYGIPDDQPVIFSASRLVEQKSLHTVVKALEFMERGRFVVAGEGPEREHIVRGAQQRGLSDRLHLLGFVPNADLPDLYAACDVLAFPSVWETFGLVIVEAAMQGAPIVTSGINASREVLAGSGQNVRFVDTRDVGDWARALNEIIHDVEARPAAKAFAPVIRERYGEARMLQSYHDLYRRLLA